MQALLIGTTFPAVGALFAKVALRRFGVFLCVGLAGLAVDAGLFAALDGAEVARWLARLVSLAGATAVTWQLNRRFTFAGGRNRVSELGRYALVTLCAQGFSYAVFLIVSAAVPALPALAALGIGAGLATALSFTGQRLFTFRAV